MQPVADHRSAGLQENSSLVPAAFTSKRDDVTRSSRRRRLKSKSSAIAVAMDDDNENIDDEEEDSRPKKNSRTRTLQQQQMQTSRRNGRHCFDCFWNIKTSTDTRWYHKFTRKNPNSESGSRLNGQPMTKKKYWSVVSGV